MMVSSADTSLVKQRQAWSELECQAIRTYVEQNPKSNWREIKCWFESKNPIETLEIQRRRQHIQRSGPRMYSHLPIYCLYTPIVFIL